MYPVVVELILKSQLSFERFAFFLLSDNMFRNKQDGMKYHLQ